MSPRICEMSEMSIQDNINDEDVYNMLCNLLSMIHNIVESVEANLDTIIHKQENIDMMIEQSKSS